MTTTKNAVLEAMKASADCAEIIHLRVLNMDEALSAINAHSADSDHADIYDEVVDVDVWGTLDDGREFRLALTGGAL